MTTHRDGRQRCPDAQQTSFGYDGDGNLRTTTYPNGVVDTIGVDAADNATSVVVANGANTLASFGYTYTPSGLVDTTTDSIAPQTNRSYEYNKLHQLVGLDTQTTAYAYDHSANLTTLPDGSTMTYDPAGQLQDLTPTSGTATNYGFDSVGNRTTATGGTTATYSYNQSNQLTNTTTVAGSGNYAYDGDGLRTSSSDNGGSRAFAWDQLTASLPLLLTDGANDYIYGPNDKVVEQVDGTSGTTTFLHQDRLGSTRLLTDAIGNAVGTNSYDPYGNLLASNGTARSPFGYDGEYTDPAGLIYLRTRYYDPSTGQFLTVDPIVDTTRAAYGYAAGDPINAVDPSGKDPCSAGGGGGCSHDGTDPTEVDTPAVQSENAAEFDRAAQLAANQAKGLQQEADIARATGLTKNTRLYRTAAGDTYPDFTDLHCGITGCEWDVFESKNIAELNWGAKQFLQYTREALVAARGVPYGVKGRLNIVISMDSKVNQADLKQATRFYAQQFNVRLNLYRFNPASGEFMPYGAAPNDVPVRDCTENGVTGPTRR